MLSSVQVIAFGAAIVTISMGVRHGFGLWMLPMTQARGWSREVFSTALAIQNLVWGFAAVVAGMIADRFGAFRVIAAGAVLYATGLVGMAFAASPVQLLFAAGALIGTAQAGTTYSVVYGVVGRNVDAQRRSLAMGAIAALGSFGQFLMVPIESNLIEIAGWASALIILGGVAALMLPLCFGLREPDFAGGGLPVREQSMTQALSQAIHYPSFLLLMAGYFVCGFQLAFIGIHVPGYLRDQGLMPQVASYSLAIIGLMNVVGGYACGVLGERMEKRVILAGIYFSRAVAIALFVLAPVSAWSVFAFSAVMGLLWLSTVPATQSIVAQIFGVQHLSMLGGVIFLSHQLGSFLGIWLGGVIFENVGSYRPVWQLSVLFGLVAGVLSLMVNGDPWRRAAARGVKL
ncbi:MFS transporter [Rhodoferax ferrireducens]|uniref:MFS transporter n=1 Tax=Rhodoferax ferrireducens TaxID=192843 RepID=UPI000E0D068A|nr:MFS transporter [Rhodoferax ferrireducens]